MYHGFMITFQFAKFIVLTLFRLKDFCEMSFIVTMVCTRQDISAKNLKSLRLQKKKSFSFFHNSFRNNWPIRHCIRQWKALLITSWVLIWVKRRIFNYIFWGRDSIFLSILLTNPYEHSTLRHFHLQVFFWLQYVLY